MSGKKSYFFSTQTTETAVMLHQHKFCVNKGKRKLKLSITCENVLFALYQFLFCFVNIFLENVEKLEFVFYVKTDVYPLLE